MILGNVIELKSYRSPKKTRKQLQPKNPKFREQLVIAVKFLVFLLMLSYALRDCGGRIW